MPAKTRLSLYNMELEPGTYMVSDYFNEGKFVQFKEEHFLKYCHLNVLEKIAEGGFGTVYTVSSGVDSSISILKRLQYLGRPQDDKEVWGDVYFLSKLRHRNIVRVQNMFIFTQCVCIIMEYCEGGTLETYVLSNKRTDICVLQRLVKELLSGLVYCHNENIAHRDVTARNILLTQSMVLKLSDFGLAVKSRDEHNKVMKSNEFLGDSKYLPPEVLRREPFDPLLVDTWSVGCVVYFMFVKQFLFTGSELEIAKKHFEYDRNSERLLQPVHPNIRQLVLNLLQLSVKSRPFLRSVITTFGKVDNIIPVV